MRTLSSASLAPSKEEAQQAIQAVRSLQRRGNQVFLRSAKSGEVPFRIPPFALRLLIRALEYMAKGNPVAILPCNSEITTQQAADILNVSRPYLIKLLDEGYIPHRKVGSHRRILMADLINYKNRDDQMRQEAINQLTEQAQRLNLGY